MKKIFCILLLIALSASFISNRAWAESAESVAREGVEKFAQEEYEEALEAFEKAARLNPTSDTATAGVQYNLGTTLSRQGKYDQAVDALTRALDYESVPSRRDAFFNLGTTRVEQAQSEGETAPDPQKFLERLQNGLDAFRESLIADPTDTDAKRNFELTRAIIRQIEEQLQQQQEQEKGGEGEQGENQDRQQSSDGEESEDSQNQEGDQQNSEQNSEEQSSQEESESESEKQQSDQEEESSEDSKEQQDQEKGLESTPKPKPSPSSQSKAQPPQSNQSNGEEEQPLTPEQLDALRALNVLEEENPDQFKQLFRFRGQGRKKLERDW